MQPKSRAQASSPRCGGATSSILEIVVAAAASLIMLLMVAGGGMAVERVIATELIDHEPPPLSPLESS